MKTNSIIQGIFYSLVVQKDRAVASPLIGPLGGPDYWTGLKVVKTLHRRCTCPATHSNHLANCPGCGPVSGDEKVLVKDQFIIDSLSRAQLGQGQVSSMGHKGGRPISTDEDSLSIEQQAATGMVNIPQRGYHQAFAYKCKCGNYFEADVCHDLCDLHGKGDQCPKEGCGMTHTSRPHFTYCEYTPMQDAGHEILMRVLTLASLRFKSEGLHWGAAAVGLFRKRVQDQMAHNNTGIAAWAAAWNPSEWAGIHNRLSTFRTVRGRPAPFTGYPLTLPELIGWRDLTLKKLVQDLIRAETFRRMEFNR